MNMSNGACNGYGSLGKAGLQSLIHQYFDAGYRSLPLGGSSVNTKPVVWSPPGNLSPLSRVYLYLFLCVKLNSIRVDLQEVGLHQNLLGGECSHLVSRSVIANTVSPWWYSCSCCFLKCVHVIVVAMWINRVSMDTIASLFLLFAHGQQLSMHVCYSYVFGNC